MVRLTILNDIVDQDLETSLDIQKSWGIRVADLRGVYGKPLLQLTDGEAARAAQAVADRGMSVYCLSSGLFFDDIDRGETYFRENHLRQVPRLIELAEVFRPAVVRLLSPVSSKRDRSANSLNYIRANHPWVFRVYREAVDRIAEAGFQVTIENEVRENVFTTPDEIVGFFEELDREGKTTFTFDVQNLWLMGTFPTMEVYRRLAPFIGYYHVKGGMADETGVRLRWKSALADASWPVAEMTRQLVRDGRCRAICLNPSHGENKPGYDYKDIYRRDVEFLKRSVPELGGKEE